MIKDLCCVKCKIIMFINIYICMFINKLSEDLYLLMRRV